MSAFSAAIAAWFVRTASSVPSSTTNPVWRAPRKPSGPRPSMPGVSRISATPCKSIWKTAPVVGCASRFARPRARNRPGARPSTWRSRSRCWRTRRPIFASSRPCRRWIAAGWTSPRCAGCSFYRHCSNSPAPAPVAAKPPTSSCCRNCSAIGCWWPMPPAVPRSTAATCRPLRGRSTAKDAAQPGPTRCSRTTPNLVWVSA